MAYANPKDRKKQVNKPVGSAAFERRMERQRARRLLDKTGADKNGNGKADVREGKDIDHKKPLSKGGTNRRSNLRVVSRSNNRSFPRNSDRSVKKNT